jgi:hypothetical protein
MQTIVFIYAADCEQFIEAAHSRGSQYTRMFQLSDSLSVRTRASADIIEDVLDECGIDEEDVEIL